MPLDLSALEEKPIQNKVTPLDGKPMRVKVLNVMPDPNQPRTIKDPDEIAEMGANIKDRGIKLPVSVKAHPDIPGKWIINDGELRWLSAQWAGLQEIPIIVDDNFDDFDQVNANEKRFNLRPIELAQFIQRKLDEGFKKGEIAKRLGKPGTYITEVLALINAPNCVNAVYESGRCTSPKTIYELRALAEKFPEEVQEWCESGVDVTRRAVSELGDALKTREQPCENSQDAYFQAKESTTETGAITDLSNNDAFSKKHNTIKKPLMIVEFEGRSAVVLLNRKPSTHGLIYIRYEDSNGEEEVDASRCKINMLSEGSGV